jgi:hypothetical protein
MLQQRKSVVKLTSVTEESQEDIRYDVSCTAYRPLSPLAPAIPICTVCADLACTFRESGMVGYLGNRFQPLSHLPHRRFTICYYTAMVSGLTHLSTWNTVCIRPC